MRHTTKLYLIIACLIAVIFWRECIHAQRQYNTRTYYNNLIACEQELDRTQDNLSELLENAKEQGRQEILEQF